MKANSILIAWLCLFCSFIGGSPGQSGSTADSGELPVQDGFTPLVEFHDKGLETDLGNRLRKVKKWNQLITQHRMAIGLVDLSDANQPSFACINCDDMMYAASLPKIAILLASMEAFEDGTLVPNKEINKDLRLMISKSDNMASTRMIDRLTFEKIEEVLRKPEYELYDENLGGGLWVGKRYASRGKRYPEPLKGLSHAATVRQICRFYYLMYNGELVNPERSRQMMEIMRDPALKHKFVNTLSVIAPQAKLYRKSGTWRTYHSDSVLVLGPKRKFILTALVDDPSGEAIMRRLAKEIDVVLQNKKTGT